MSKMEPRLPADWPGLHGGTAEYMFFSGACEMFTFQEDYT
jgi:hypothetical protein